MGICVAPLVGARIEINFFPVALFCRMSLPSWERGLKSGCQWEVLFREPVAPLVGARIEITTCLTVLFTIVVAPLVGARIEIKRDFPLHPTP